MIAMSAWRTVHTLDRVTEQDHRLTGLPVGSLVRAQTTTNRDYIVLPEDDGMPEPYSPGVYVRAQWTYILNPV